MNQNKLLQFGAGNIGRSFVGQIFARYGYEVVFVDVDEELLAALNRTGTYDVVLKHPDGREERIVCSGVRGINALEKESVAEELASVAYVATSVGGNAIGHLVPALAAETLRRHQEEPRRPPFDLILAENIHNGAALLRKLILEELPAGFPEEALPGIVECSVGKMVPILPEEVKRAERTTLFAEPYNELILDEKAWRNPIPQIPQLRPVSNISAYVDRKLYIHNLGHAAAAYVGHAIDPGAHYLWELLEKPAVLDAARAAMVCSAEALLRGYPESFTAAGLREHIEDLLYRFKNRALGDTVHRVGRDLQRKLGKEDRVVGAIRFALSHGVDPSPIARVYAAALRFRAADEGGNLFPGDEEFHRALEDRGSSYALTEVSGLEPGEPAYEVLASLLSAPGGA